MGGEDLLLALPEQADEQGLRKALRHRGSVHLRSNDAPDGEAVGPCIGFFKQFLEKLSEKGRSNVPKVGSDVMRKAKWVEKSLPGGP